MLRKITIIVVAAFLKYNAFSRALVVLVVLGISIYFQTIKKPFFSEVLNELEYRAIIVSLFTIYFGLFYYVTPDDYGKILTIIVIICSNVYFLSYWFLQVVASQYEFFLKMLKCFPRLQAIMIKIKDKISNLDQFTLKKSGSLEKNKGMQESNSVLRGDGIGSASVSVSESKVRIKETKKIFPKKIKGYK